MEVKKGTGMDMDMEKIAEPSISLFLLERFQEIVN